MSDDLKGILEAGILREFIIAVACWCWCAVRSDETQEVAASQITDPHTKPVSHISSRDTFSRLSSEHQLRRQR